MMKSRFIELTVFFLLSACSLMAQSEEQNGRRPETAYPHSSGLPKDVIWSRELYRTLNMDNPSNGALYYPVQPEGDNYNLITIIFRLLSENKIPAYEYLLDGNERLYETYRINFRDILDRFEIPYNQKSAGRSRDSLLIVDSSDIPSAEVLSYFIKEVWFFDQRTSTFGSRITAICPVLHRSDNAGLAVLKMPMFWLNYTDLSTYLTRVLVSTSNLNSAARSNLDDFFNSRLYQGDIYKTTNLLSNSVSELNDSDSLTVVRQKLIEQQLELFEKNLYGKDLTEDSIKANMKQANRTNKIRKR